MSEGGWRRSLARWLDPSIEVPPAAESAPSAPHLDQAPAVNPWLAISEQFALRVLAAVYQMSSHLEAAEADERDPDRLEKLYRIDHASTRVRRQAENLQVLGGRQVEDAGRQITSMLDVVRAALSAIEYFSRVQLGRIAELAVVEFAADDVIRVLTELLDNATRFSPPSSQVMISAHLTERGSILVRIEDSGIGIRPDQLAAMNMMLAGHAPPPLHTQSGLQLGLAVVQRLALTHQMRVHLGHRQPSGTTASVLIPDHLICEIPGTAYGAAPSLPPAPPPQYRPQPDAAYLTGRQEHGRMIDRQPITTNGAVLGPPAAPQPGPVSPSRGGAADSRDTGGGLPIRVPTSLREQQQQMSGGPDEPFVATPVERGRWADETADFAAGIDDARATNPPMLEG